MSFFFISYKREDEEFAKELVETLNKFGIQTWRDKDDIQPADLWEEEIDKAIEDCKALILILSPEALQSQWVAYEWVRAIHLDKKIIPIRWKNFDDAKRHIKLGQYQEIDFTDSNDKTRWASLTDYLRNYQGQPVASLSVKNAVWALSEPKLENRKEAIDTLVRSPDPAAIEELAKAVADEKHQYTDDVRIEGAFALAKKTEFRDDRAVSGLHEVLQKNRHEIRNNSQRLAIDYLGRIAREAQSERAVEILMQASTYHLENFAIEDIARSLGNSKSSLAVPCLQQMISLPNIRVVEEAVLAFGNIGDLSTVETIKSVLETHSWIGARQAAVRALGMIKDDASLDALFEALCNLEQDYKVRGEVVNILNEPSPKDAEILQRFKIAAQSPTLHGQLRQQIYNSINQIEKRLRQNTNQ